MQAERPEPLSEIGRCTLQAQVGARKGIFGSLGDTLGSFYERRWLIVYLARRQLFAGYQESFLGIAWAILTPLLMVALYTLVFSSIIGIRFREVEGDATLNFGIFLYCGLLPFLAFSEALNRSVNIIRTNSQFVKNLVFPTEILPLSTSIGTVIDKFFGLGIVAVVLLVLEGRLNWTLVLVPFFVVLQVVFVLGLSYFFAAIGALIPDIRESLSAVVRVMFFVTPIIWPASLAEERGLGLVVHLNPVAFLVGAYRGLILEGEIPSLISIGLFSLFSLAMLIVGFTVFMKVKHRFADLV